MLFVFFSKRLFSRFFLLAVCLVLVFSTAHFFVRLSAVNFLTLIPIIFGIMVPMVLQYVIPIASGAAVYLTIGECTQRQETLVLYFLRHSQMIFGGVILLFSFLVALFYAFLIFSWVPQSYTYGKEALVRLAQQQFLHYQPNCVHEPMPGLSLIFQGKQRLDSSTVNLEHLFLSFKNKQETYYFTAQQGVVTDTVFFLTNGSLLYQSGKEHYYSSFNRTSFDIKKLIQSYDHSDKNKLPMKYLSWNQVTIIEQHKRCANVLWQFLLPIIIFLGSFFLKPRKNVILEAFFLSGFIFLLMYIFLTIGQVIDGVGGLGFFYLPPILIFCFCLYHYQHCS